MSPKRFVLAASLAGLVSFGTTARAAGPIRILALGDSYTAGTAVKTSEAWPAILVSRLRADKLDVADATVIAHEGWTAEELMAGIQEANPQGPFDIVTVMIGVNNQYRGGTADSFAPKLKAVVDRAIALAGNRPYNVILITIPDYSVTPFGQQHNPRKTEAEIEQFNGKIVALRRQYKLRIADFTPISREAADSPKLIAEDGLHPSPVMHDAWAEMVYDAARLVLSGPPKPHAPARK